MFDTFEDAEAADLEQWLAVPARERMMLGEALREEAFPDHEPGLQRILQVVERSER
jgi:hypothetical protein